MEIHEKTIGKAHESVIRAILEDGREKTVETDDIIAPMKKPGKR